MALKARSNGFPKRNDHPSWLLKTSNIPVALMSSTCIVPVHVASEHTVAPFAICRVHVEGCHPCSLCLIALNVAIDMAPVMAPSSNRAGTVVASVPSGFFRDRG